MDLNRPITYRSFEFNTLEDLDQQDVLAGTTTDSVEWGEVEVLGFTEKRALDDGHDASDVYYGRRRITLRGSVYSRTRGGLFDRLREMRLACNPRLSAEEAPGERGYQPLLFQEASNLSDFTAGYAELMVRARAASGVKTTINREQLGGEDTQPLRAGWEVTFECVDPMTYIAERSIEFISGSSGSVTEAANRGGFPAKVNLILVADADTDKDRTFSFDGAGTSFDILVPQGAYDTIIRLDGERKVVTRQTLSNEAMAMSLIDIDLTWPMLQTGVSDMTWSFIDEDDVDATLASGSCIWWREAMA